MGESVLSDLVPLLQQHGQDGLLSLCSQLSAQQQNMLLQQIRNVDFSLLEDAPAAEVSQPGVSRADQAAAPRTVVLQPTSAEDDAQRVAAAHLGEQLLSAGRVAVITVAGGQGSRLGFDHPKGMFPIGPVSDRTLFQVFADQIAARRQRHGAEIPWYLMTSDATHDVTVDFFRQHSFFGLPADSVFFFRQASLPAVDAESGQLLLNEQGQLCLSPDGHGGMISALQASGCLQKMAEQQIEHVYYHQVDNPTAIVCDPVLLGLHAQQDSQLTTNVVRKASPGERMGVLVDIAGRTEIIEYSELTEEQAAREDDQGQWIFWAGNTAIHVFRRDFLEYLAQDGIRLPLHRALKVVPCLTAVGTVCTPETANAVKRERFIFDALPLATRTLIVEGDRQREFNPVKNATGADSPESSRAALNRIGREWLQQAGQTLPDDTAVEIGARTALDAEELATRLTQGQVALEDLIGRR